MAPALLIAQDCVGQVHLIIGSGPLAASRCTKSLEAGARPIIIAPADSDVHYTLAKHVDSGRAVWIQRRFEDDDLRFLGREEVENVVDAVFVTVGATDPLSTHISSLCRRLRVPVNVADAPNLCTFTLLSTHSDGPLQIGITTSGRGCKLSSRIRREVAASLPPKFGDVVERLGTIRRRIWEEDHAAQLASDPDAEEEDSINQKHTFNNFVDPSAPDPEIARNRRMRWLSQICEYWPLQRLAAITDADISTVLSAYTSTTSTTDSVPLTPSTVDARLERRGNIILAGSGPGHPDLLTRATYTAIQHADFILADKLVPAGVLDLIPRRTPVHIARKFPGNADAAQEELLHLGLGALEQGKTVLRLKQGDPYLYGRGAEELAFFRAHGFEAKVLPGVTSAFSAPLFANIPVTHRAVSDQVLVCTGTGRKGAAPNPPAYVASQTVVFLMALHRLESLVNNLTIRQPVEDDEDTQRALWPLQTPCAVIERASCPDQRVIRSTLEHICKAVENEGSRPPGLLVLGWSCNVLHRSGGQRWVVEEGFRGLDGIGAEEGLDLVKELGEFDVGRKGTIVPSKAPTHGIEAA
jgi:uroporphyrin-III C-methyltransferase